MAERDTEKLMWYMKDARINKGLAENGLLASEKQHETTFETLVIRPGAVVEQKSAFLSLPFTSSLVVGVDAVGAVLTDLAVNGSVERLLLNPTVRSRGKELLSRLSE